MEETQGQLENRIRTDDQGFIDAAIQNPDNSRRAGIPDGVNGASVLRDQKIQAIITAAGLGLTDYDLYIVDWNFEPVGGSTNLMTGRFLIEGDSGAAFLPPKGTGIIYDPTPVSELVVGGLCAYIMAPGTSPFPSTDPAVTGLVVPAKTVQLLFSDDMLTGHLRIVGKEFKAEYTAPEITAKGTVTQSELVSYQNLNSFLLTTGGLYSNPVIGGGVCFEQPLPAGSTKEHVKYPGAVTRTAYDGVLQSANVHLDYCRPELPNFQNLVFRASEVQPSIGKAVHLHVGSLWVGGTPPVNNGVSRPKYDSHSDINMAVFQGLAGEATFQLTRQMTVETFPSPGSNLIAFARPSPLYHPQEIVDVMNGIRTSQRFWAAADNSFGNFARGLRRGISKAGKAATAVASVHPATAGAVSQARAAKKAATTNDPHQRVAQLERLVAKMGVDPHQNETVTQARPRRRRTKAASMPRSQTFAR